jgi:hypothetical protein
MIFGQQVALIDSPEKFANASVKATTAQVELGDLNVELPPGAESPRISLDGLQQYTYPASDLFFAVCVPLPPPVFSYCLRLPSTDFIVAYVSDEEASNLALYSAAVQLATSCAGLLGNAQWAACMAETGTSLVLPVVLNAVQGGPTGQLAWVEASQAAWFDVGLGGRPDWSNVREAAQMASSTAQASMAVQQWTDAICENWYCTPAEAIDGWQNYEDVPYYPPSGALSPEEGEVPPPQNYGEKCVDSGHHEVAADSKKCKQLAKVQVAGYVDRQTASRYDYLVNVSRSRGYIDGSQEDIGLGYTGPQSAFSYTLLSSSRAVFSIHQKVYENAEGCLKAYDRQNYTNDTSWSCPYGNNCTFSDARSADHDTSGPLIGWRSDFFWNDSNSSTQARERKQSWMLSYKQGWWSVQGSNCGHPDYNSEWYLTHRIVAAGMSVQIQGSQDYDAGPAELHGVFTHRWVTWENAACHIVLDVGGAVFSRTAGQSVTTFVGGFVCDVVFKDKNWKLDVGPAKQSEF